MSKSVGKSVIRVDAYEKATGRAKYMDDLCDRSALIAKICHSTIAHGFVKSVDTSAAEAVPGVVKVLTCFDAPDIEFPTAGHPWSTDPHHQDVADRKLLNRHVRYYGDEVAVVIAEDEIAAAQAVRAIRVEYEVLPFVLDVQEAMKDGAPQIQEPPGGGEAVHLAVVPHVDAVGNIVPGVLHQAENIADQVQLLFSGLAPGHVQAESFRFQGVEFGFQAGVFVFPLRRGERGIRLHKNPSFLSVLLIQLSIANPAGGFKPYFAANPGGTGPALPPSAAGGYAGETCR